MEVREWKIIFPQILNGRNKRLCLVVNIVTTLHSILMFSELIFTSYELP